MTNERTVWCVLTHHPSDHHLVSIHAEPGVAEKVASKNDGWYVQRWAVQVEPSAPPGREVTLGPVRRHPEVCHGQLTFTDTRVWVDSLFGYLRAGHSVDEWREDYPSVSLEQAQETLDLALQLLEEATRTSASGRP